MKLKKTRKFLRNQLFLVQLVINYCDNVKKIDTSDVFSKKCNIKNSLHFSEFFIKFGFPTVQSPLRHRKMLENDSRSWVRVGRGFILAAAKFEPVALNLHFWLRTPYPWKYRYVRWSDGIWRPLTSKQICTLMCPRGFAYCFRGLVRLGSASRGTYTN